MNVDRTVFAGRPSFIAGRASAAVEGGIAVHLLQEGRAAIRDATMHHAQRASFADGRATGPVHGNRERAEAAQPGGSGMNHGLGYLTDENRHAFPVNLPRYYRS